MAVIRSRLSHSASLLTLPRSYPYTPPVHHGFCQGRGENVFAGTAPPFTSEHSGSAVQSPSSYRERIAALSPQSICVSIQEIEKHKNKAKIWEHQFVCLASKTKCSPPGPIDRGHL